MEEAPLAYYPGSKEGHIPTRSASEGSGAFPSLARRVNMQQHAELPCRGNNKQIKDSIHLETYLELSRKVRDAGYGQPVIFASTNSSDFWEDKNTPERPHAELVDELATANLVFFGRLPLALRHLGLLGPAATPFASPAGGP